MTKYGVWMLAVLALSAVAQPEIAPLPGEQAIRPLFEGADLVCFCSVQSVEALGSGAATSSDGREPRTMAAAIQVRNIYKSSTANLVSATIQFEEGQLWNGEMAILFLKSTSSGAYALADPFIGSTPFSSMPTTSRNSGLPGLESSLADLLQLPGRDDQINAMKLLQGLDVLDADTSPRLILLSDSKDPEIALSALAVLLKGKNPADVSRLRAYLAGYPSDSGPIAVTSIGTELGQIRDRAALLDLEALTDSKLISIRIGSMQALRAMRNMQSAQALVGRLDDPDGYVRYLAIISLAEIVGRYGDYAPNMHLFDQNPEYYVGLWRTWWKEEGKLAVKPASQ